MIGLLSWGVIALMYVFLWFGVRATLRQLRAARRQPASVSAPVRSARRPLSTLA